MKQRGDLLRGWEAGDLLRGREALIETTMWPRWTTNTEIGWLDLSDGLDRLRCNNDGQPRVVDGVSNKECIGGI